MKVFLSLAILFCVVCTAGEHALREETPLELRLPVEMTTKFHITNSYGDVTVYEESGDEVVIRGKYVGQSSATLRINRQNPEQFSLDVTRPRLEKANEYQVHLTIGIPAAAMAGLFVESGNGDVQIEGNFRNDFADGRKLVVNAPGGRIAIKDLQGAGEVTVGATGEINFFDVLINTLRIVSYRSSASISRSNIADAGIVARRDIELDRLQSDFITAKSHDGRIAADFISGVVYVGAKNGVRLVSALCKSIKAVSKRGVIISNGTGDLDISADGLVEVERHEAGTLKVVTQDRARFVHAEGDYDVTAVGAIEVRDGVASKMVLRSLGAGVAVSHSETNLQIEANGDADADEVTGDLHSLFSRSGSVHLRDNEGETLAHAAKGNVLVLGHLRKTVTAVALNGSVTFHNPDLVDGEEIAQAGRRISKTKLEGLFCPKAVALAGRPLIRTAFGAP